jgi:hypothetical protein
VFVPPLAVTLPELDGTIGDAVATVTLDLLNNVWTEIKYRYIFRATHGALIEHLQKCMPQILDHITYSDAFSFHFCAF